MDFGITLPPIHIGQRMSKVDVFRPSDGPLFVRGNLSNGLSNKTDMFRKDRPATQGGYRFGKRSANSFFTRHNPHPGRVRHIKGLLDIPICAVNDNGYFSNPRYSLQFPPNSADYTKLRNDMQDRLPCNVINVNSQQYPINTITGLQYFMGKPLNFRVFREKAAAPKYMNQSTSDVWRDELRALTDAIGVANNNLPKLSDAKPMTPATPQRKCMTADGIRPRTSQYSAATGRLLPPPSRAMSRQASRQGRTDQLDILGREADMETMVLQMLCQILQTEDVRSVQSWLVSANDREKSLVLDMLRAALSTNEDIYQKAFGEERTGNMLPEINGDVAGTIIGDDNAELGKRIDRLSLMGDDAPPRAVSQLSDFLIDKTRIAPQRSTTIHEEDETMVQPHMNDVFECARPPSRPRSVNRSRTPTKSNTPTEAKLKYTDAAAHQKLVNDCTHVTDDERIK